MKKFTKLLGILLVVFFSALSHRAEASHYKGGDIYFVCLGGGQYELVTSFYYACEATSIRFDTVAADFEWTITSSCGLPSFILAATTSASQDVPFYCPGVATTCDYWNGSSYAAPAGTAIGTVVVTYTSAPFTIPDGCTVTASITEGSRNAAITNLQNPGGQSMDITTSVTTPPSGTGCSNNPVFAAYPVNVFCVDQNANFSQGAIDISGDSLTYTLVNPETSGGIAIPFLGAGCTATNPMGAPTTYASVFTFDSTTGNINFTPTQIGNYVLAVQVNAYQSGVLVGTTVRDIQFTVIACTDYTAPPFLTQLFTTADIVGGTVIDSTHIGVCPGEPVQINLAATIGDSFQYVIDSTNALQALPGSTISVTHSGTKFDTATLHIFWTPQNSDSGYHYILVTVKDTICPLPGRQTYAFLVSVLSGLYAGPNLVYCNGGSPVTIYANGANHYLWTDSATGGPPLNVIAYGPDSSWIEVAPTHTTGYIVHGDLLGSCKNIDTVTVVNAPDFTLTAAALDTSICKYTTTTLTATTNPGSVGPFSYSWTPVGSVTSPNAASTSTGHLTSNTQFFVTATAAGGCTLRDSLNVYLSGAAPQIGITPSNNGVCPGDTITLVGQALAQNLVACGLVDSCATLNTNVSIPVPFGPSDTANSTGTGTGGFTDVYCSPFMGSFNSYKIQYLFRASELNAAGLSSGTITDISFFVKTAQSTIPYDTFAISIGCTNLDSLTDFVNGLTTVAGPLEGFPAPTVFQGWNSFPFYDPVSFNNTFYNWDGVSNIVIQVCYTLNPTATSNDDFVAYTTTPYNGSSIYAGAYPFEAAGNGCGLSYASTFDYGINNTRATIKFGMCVPNVVTYQWSPAASVTCPTCLITQAVIDSTTCFTLTANDNGCANDSTICIYTNPYIPVRITPSDTTICHVGDSVHLLAYPVDTAPSLCVLGYSVDSIPYSAVAGTFTSIAPTAFKDEYGNTRATSAGVAGPYPIGFSFPFYCQTYDTFYVDADGFITFEYPYNYGMAAWEYTAETLPPASFPPLKSIALLMGHYFLADGFGIGLGNAKYELTGTAPNRELVVKYTNMEDYNIGTSRTNGEIILHETTGIIDILITSTTYSGDPHTTGVIDSTGYGTAAPGMNNQYYTVAAGSPVAWRFTPQYGPSAIQTGLIWQTGQGITTINDTLSKVSVAPDSSHTYYVQASYIINQFTNPEGCVVHDSAKVTIAPLIDTIKAVPTIICPGGTAQLSLTNTTNITSYSWNHGSDLSNPAISNPIATISDSTLFIVSLVNNIGCTTKDSLTLNTFPNQYPVIGPSTTICYSDSVELSLYGSYSNFQWYYIDTASGIHTLISSGPADSIYYAHPPGYYDLVVTASPSGCDYTTNAVFVDTFARETIAVDTSGPTSFCAGGFVTLSVTPGLNNIIWTPDSFGSQLFIPVSSSGTFSYTARDAHNCLLFSNTVTVTVDPRPTVNIAYSKNPVCTGETAQIIATTTPPGVPVVWQLAGTQVASGDTFSGAAPGTYEVIAAPACPDTVPAVVNSAVSATVTLGPNIDSCTCSPNIVLDPVVTPSSPLDSFAWSGSSSDSTYAVTTVGSGTYTVTVYDANRCSATASVSVTVGCVPTTAFASPDTTYPGGTFLLSDSPSVSGFSYLWTTADSSTIANATQVQTNATSGNMQAGIDTFHLHVTDPSSACYGDTVLYVIVITKDSFVFPTAFTPNGDGKNDYFFPVFNSVSAAHISVLRIYNRWGQLVYDNPNTPGWDGNYGDKPQPVGTYLIFMTVQVPDPADASRLIQRSVQASFELQR